MAEERSALIADIHGNIWALDAVLADIDRRGITAIYDLGDTLYGPMAPRETAERLMARQILSVRGNCDRAIIDPETLATPSLNYTRSQLAPEHLAWLRAFPATRVVGADLLLCHGTPTSDETYLVEEPTPRGSVLRAPDAILADLAGAPQAVIACAHSHVPRAIMLASGQMIVNPGSVGMQAYTEPTFIMETGSPHARYAILHHQNDQWSFELVLVPYDWQSAADSARTNGQPDRAQMQLTGRAC
jgi:predicted phosphodiesterase